MERRVGRGRRKESGYVRSRKRNRMRGRRERRKEKSRR